MRAIIVRVVEESGLSRLTWDEEHAGSNPAYPTNGSVEQLVGSPDCKSGLRKELVGSSPTASTRARRIDFLFNCLLNRISVLLPLLWEELVVYIHKSGKFQAYLTVGRFKPPPNTLPP